MTSSYHLSNIFWGRSLEANKCIDLVFTFLAEILFGFIKGNARITLDVNHLNDFHSRRICEDILVPAETFIEIDLARHREENHIPFAIQFLYCNLRSHCSGAIVVSADKEQPLALWRIRINSNDWDSGGNRRIDLWFHNIWIRYRNQNARRFCSYCPSKFVCLPLWIVSIGSKEIVLYLNLSGSAPQP